MKTTATVNKPKGSDRSVPNTIGSSTAKVVITAPRSAVVLRQVVSLSGEVCSRCAVGLCGESRRDHRVTNSRLSSLLSAVSETRTGWRPQGGAARPANRQSLEQKSAGALVTTWSKVQDMVKGRTSQSSSSLAGTGLRVKVNLEQERSFPLPERILEEQGLGSAGELWIAFHYPNG